MSQKIVLGELYRQAAVMEADDFEAAVSYIEVVTFDLILLDIDIPGGKGKSMIDRIRQRQPRVIILVCSAADEQIHALEYIAAGANGYVSKSVDRDELVVAITTVMKNKRYVSSAIQDRLLSAVSTGSSVSQRQKISKNLSGREKEVMDLLIEGKWVKEIAFNLNLRANTISTYKARIFEKMGVTSVIDLAKKVQGL